ncbi:hypothetical protein [Caballeronia sp. AZ10_KS36]|uniref:hypothetical protein n=1 Tax=Caballeronia sp. AZ10_KS36 TaxID=2921757 RepID=UPI00202924A2|nr:hypothetical protein [Caballeronia sp. AZ10_KS36]
MPYDTLSGTIVNTCGRAVVPEIEFYAVYPNGDTAFSQSGTPTRGVAVEAGGTFDYRISVPAIPWNAKMKVRTVAVY